MGVATFVIFAFIVIAVVTFAAVLRTTNSSIAAAVVAVIAAIIGVFIPLVGLIIIAIGIIIACKK